MEHNERPEMQLSHGSIDAVITGPLIVIIREGDRSARSMLKETDPARERRHS